jgi:hypothetical protein
MSPTVPDAHTNHINPPPALDCSAPVDATVPETIEHTFGSDSDQPYASQHRRALNVIQGGETDREASSRPKGELMSTTPLYSPLPELSTKRGLAAAPLLRYRPHHDVAPMWSDEADWTDLTIQHDMSTTQPGAAGWGRRWTMTYRHGTHEATVPVADASPADLLMADPIRVNHWHPNRRSRPGLRFLHSTGRHHAHESLFERKLLLALDFADAVDVASQPFTLTWHDGTRWRHHTPDFMALVNNLPVVINTRPAELLNAAIMENSAALEEVCLANGWGHALVVGYPLPAMTTVETVEVHANAADRFGCSEQIVEYLFNWGPSSFLEVCQSMGSPVIARAILQRLIWDRRVRVDLNQPLNDASTVSLVGTVD